MDELAHVLRPEFLNRLDATILFRRLGRDDMATIVDLQLGQLEKRLADQGMEIDVSAAARLWLGDKGYDPQFGARPLKRVIQNEIHNALAKRLLDHQFDDGDRINIDLDAKADALTFEGVLSDQSTPDLQEASA